MRGCSLSFPTTPGGRGTESGTGGPDTPEGRVDTPPNSISTLPARLGTVPDLGPGSLLKPVNALGQGWELCISSVDKLLNDLLYPHQVGLNLDDRREDCGASPCFVPEGR